MYYFEFRLFYDIFNQREEFKMLLEEFDSNKKAILNAEDFHEKLPEMPKTCVSFFSKRIMKEIEENYPVQVIASISNATAKFPIYKINVNGVDLAIYHSPVGAPACVGCFEEAISLGIEKILLVGCCGCLDSSLDDYSLIIPTSAIRDEGTSYHYAPVYDETIINEKSVEVLEGTLKRLSLKYSKGKTWTTDAMFRETREKAQRRKEQGAITVDMECSAMNIVAEYRKVKFAQLFYAADNLDGEEYDPRSLVLGDETMEQKKKIIPIAFECAIDIDKKL